MAGCPSRRASPRTDYHFGYTKAPANAGANVSIILGHFQKCLTHIFMIFFIFSHTKIYRGFVRTLFSCFPPAGSRLPAFSHSFLVFFSHFLPSGSRIHQILLCLSGPFDLFLLKSNIYNKQGVAQFAPLPVLFIHFRKKYS